MAFATILWLGAYSFGLPELPRVFRQGAAAAIGAALVGALGFASVQSAFGVQLLPRFVLIVGAAAVVPWLSALSVASMRSQARRIEGDRILLVAAEASAAQLIAELESMPTPVPIAGFIEPDAARSDSGGAPLLEKADNAAATVVVLDRQAQVDQSIVDQVALLHERGVRVRTLSLFYEQWLLRLPVSELERVSLMFDIGEIHRARYGRRKRLADMAVASALLPVLVALVPVVAAVNVVANPGTLFFRQERVGKNGDVFEILKFRTMRGAGRGAGPWTTDADDRIPSFGALLRRTHVDEIPQVLNILRGDLSIVGPRPEQPHYVAELSTKLPFYDLRHLVNPGLTGWAQIHQSYAASEGDALEKLQYEFWYLRNQSMAMDLRIVARTIRTIVRGGGR